MPDNVSDNESVENLRKLRLKRGQIKSQLTRLSTFLTTFDLSTGNYQQLEARLEKTVDSLEFFNDTQNELEYITGVIEDQEREEFLI